MESDHQEQDLTDAKLQNEIHRNEIGKQTFSFIPMIQDVLIYRTENQAGGD